MLALSGCRAEVLKDLERCVLSIWDEHCITAGAAVPTWLCGDFAAPKHDRSMRTDLVGSWGTNLQRSRGTAAWYKNHSNVGAKFTSPDRRYRV